MWFPQAPAFAEEGENIEQRLRLWQRSMGIRSQNHLCVIIPCLILWYLWTERNENVHREKAFEEENVIKKVTSQLRNLVLAKLIGLEQWKDCSPKLDIMVDMSSKARTRKVGRVQWRPPDPLWIKLNVDGAFLQATQSAGGGGVVRNHEGEILAAFATDLKGRSGLEAEILALLLGVTLAKQYGQQIWIEMDAEIVVRWLCSEQLGSAEVCTSLAKVTQELKEISWKVSHIFREGNKAADYLAEVGIQSGVRTFFHSKLVTCSGEGAL